MGPRALAGGCKRDESQSRSHRHTLCSKSSMGVRATRARGASVRPRTHEGGAPAQEGSAGVEQEEMSITVQLLQDLF